MKDKKTYCRIGGCKKARLPICCRHCKLPEPEMCRDFCRNNPERCGLTMDKPVRGRKKKAGEKHG